LALVQQERAMRFLKLELLDEDEPVVTTVEEENLHCLLQAELKEYRDDDRLEPCYGVPKTLHVDEDSVQWTPGNGGQYTVARYFLDSPAGREELEAELKANYE
jgi:hypothetical protein